MGWIKRWTAALLAACLTFGGALAEEAAQETQPEENVLLVEEVAEDEEQLLVEEVGEDEEQLLVIEEDDQQAIDALGADMELDDSIDPT